jgi:hypothetical protein
MNKVKSICLGIEYETMENGKMVTKKVYPCPLCIEKLN